MYSDGPQPEERDYDQAFFVTYYDGIPSYLFGYEDLYHHPGGIAVRCRQVRLRMRSLSACTPLSVLSDTIKFYACWVYRVCRKLTGRTTVVLIDVA